LKISIIGSGNVATRLGFALQHAGNDIVEIVSRNAESGKQLALLLNTDFVAFTSHYISNADILLLCVKDDAIEAISQLLLPQTAIIAHTSGFKSKMPLQALGDNFGIFYPLQTMRKEVDMDFSKVPVMIEGSNESTKHVLEEVAKGITVNVHVIEELQRQYIHVAAVFANNFTNQMLVLSESILNMHALEFDILRPLIHQSMENVMNYSPSALQTGPAVRKDFLTIEAHLLLLANDEKMQQVYRIITESILNNQLNNLP
jgi:predicted short-subunit dehydrogenase-like oxidoreductase (DUF2520 family)